MKIFSCLEIKYDVTHLFNKICKISRDVYDGGNRSQEKTLGSYDGFYRECRVLLLM